MGLFSFSNKPKNVVEADKTRLEITGPLSVSDAKWLCDHKTMDVLQVAKPISGKTWENLNNNLFAKRRDVEFRVYGYYGLPCDLDFLRAMKEVRILSVDCLQEAENVKAACELPNLKEFCLGIYKLESFECLNGLPNTLEGLYLAGTKSNKPSLRVLEKFKDLKRLSLEGQSNGIETIKKISNLEKLAFRSITLENLELLRTLPNLWSFELRLGGTKDLTGLESAKKLKYLEIWMVRGLSRLDSLGQLESIQYLFLQDLKNVRKLPSLKKLKKLRRVHLEGMKGLRDLKPIADVQSLESLFILSGDNLNVNDFLPFVGHKKLKSAFVGTGSMAKNKKIMELLKVTEKPGYSRDFVFE